VSLVIHEGMDSRGSHDGNGESSVRGSHDIEGVRCTYIGHDGIVLGVTPPGTFRKMNQDNDCLFNANLMNELMYDHVCYVYDYVHHYVRMIPCKLCSRKRVLDAKRHV
jgi:hypothetical protein